MWCIPKVSGSIINEASPFGRWWTNTYSQVSEDGTSEYGIRYAASKLDKQWCCYVVDNMPIDDPCCSRSQSP